MMKVWQPAPEEIEITRNWGTWKKEVSEFSWFYDEPETCYILQGDATVTDETGNSIHFKAGDMVQFEQGQKCVWKINQDITKKYQFG
jgi:uncharacterized cupin superfamily protein